MNTSEIFKSAHQLTSFEFRTSRGRSYRYSAMTYRQIFSILLKEKWAAAKIANEPVQSFVVSISYNEHDLRGLVKGLRGTWNADTKTWSINCKKSQLGKLASKVLVVGNAASYRSHKNEWLVNGRTIQNNLSYGEMWNRFGTDFE